MRLTTHTDYALRVLIYLALQAGRLVTVAEIAQCYGQMQTGRTNAHFSERAN